jgi:dolichyl-phosphate-mannose-protein mannosyltransferase
MTRVTTTSALTDEPPAPADEGSVESAAEPSPAQRLRERLVPPMPTDRVWGWVGPLLVTALAGLLRFWDLGKPKDIIFDETYYAKDAYSLLQYGYERELVEGADEQVLAGATTEVYKLSPEYVVHPPVGKWVIAAGEQIFGFNPYGWRFAVALMGTVAVLVLARTARRMFRSTLLGCFAALLLAVDGLALVLSRTALLDGILAWFVLFAFACLVADRDWGRRRMADHVERHWSDTVPLGRFDGPDLHLWWRPWRLAAGLFLGLACATKWSGLYFLAAFFVMALFWDAGARKAAGFRHYRLATLRRDLLPALLMLAALPVVVYVASWAGWIWHAGEPAGFYRNWATDRGGATLSVWLPVVDSKLFSVHVPFVPDWWRSLWHYHAEAYRFHKDLSSSHPYDSNAWGWLPLARPVAFYYETVKTPPCPTDNCSSAITGLGNPVIWWAGILALFHSLWRLVAHRDWRGGAILAGFAGGLLPWLVLFADRTIFSFYSVVLVPFIALALTQAAAAVLGPADRPGRRTVGSVLVAGYLAAAVLMTAYFWPVLTGDVIPYDDWNARMWFQAWI